MKQVVSPFDILSEMALELNNLSSFFSVWLTYQATSKNR